MATAFRTLLAQRPLLVHTLFGAATCVASDVLLHEYIKRFTESGRKHASAPQLPRVSIDGDTLTVDIELSDDSTSPMGIAVRSVLGAFCGIIVRYWYPLLERVVPAGPVWAPAVKAMLDTTPQLVTHALEQADACEALADVSSEDCSVSRLRSHTIPQLVGELEALQAEHDRDTPYDEDTSLARRSRHASLLIAANPIVSRLDACVHVCASSHPAAVYTSIALSCVNLVLVPRQLRGLFGLAQWMLRECIEQVDDVLIEEEVERMTEKFPFFYMLEDVLHDAEPGDDGKGDQADAFVLERRRK